ncbi:sensor histidine kinase [Gracilimonas sp.]|uniref:sensor histidine kinase n=1 Tax=Gracilimonas sp. TaxID=1974203 RepID=UPI003D1128CC
MKFWPKYRRTIFTITLLIASIIGMAEYKQQLEQEKLLQYEVYFWTFAVLFWGTLTGVIFTQIYDRWESYQQLKNEHAKAELALLKSKVDPHFFFNTLNNLYGLTVGKSEKAPDVILKLSEIMRYVIYDSSDERVPLNKEVEYLEKYIELFKIRFHKKVDISFSSEIENENELIAPLILSIFVENAFKHGAEQLIENAFIHIYLKAENGTLNFLVKNNFKRKKDTTKSGIGLTNLKKRLKLIYPKKHQLALQKDERLFTANLTINLR